MVFNNSTTEDSIISEIDRICNSDDNVYPLKAKTARVNAALDHFYSIALMYDTGWGFDDPNQTDLPIGIANIVSGQQDYQFASELLLVHSVYVQDSSSNWNRLDEQTTPENTYLLPSGNSGTPTKFKLIGNSILLDYIPNSNITGGLKVVFSRTASRFVSTDTTKIPGIPSLFHPYLAQFASLPYLIEKQKPQKNDIATLIMKAENPQDPSSIPSFMAKRNRTRKPRLGTTMEDNR